MDHDSESGPNRAPRQDKKSFDAKSPKGKGGFKDGAKGGAKGGKPGAKPAANSGQRIAKVLARAGFASRREIERLIGLGLVAVNGRLLDTPAVLVQPDDVITVEGRPIGKAEATRVWRYHKPVGLLTSHADPKGRPTVFASLPEHLPRVISVGRLDLNSEGLLLLTNDGELARALELPANAWVRRYRARCLGNATQATLDKLKDGVTVDGVHYGPMDAKLDKAVEKADGRANLWVSVTITEGKNREVRKVLESIGLKVNRLIRLAYGPFALGDLPQGEVEEVGPRVVRELLGDKIAEHNLPPENAAQTQDAPKPRGSDDKGRRGGGERFARDDKPRFKRDGDKPYGKKPFGDKKPYGEKSYGDKPRKPREDGGFAERKFTPRTDAVEGGDFAERPFRPRGDKPRGDRPYGDRPRSDRPFGDKPRRDFAPRGESRGEGRGEGGDRPFKPRGDRPFRPRDGGDSGNRDFKPRGDRPFRSRDGEAPSGERRSFGDKPRRDFASRGEGRSEGGDRPFKPRGDKPFRPRDGGDSGNRDFKPRGDRPFRSRDGDAPSGERKSYGDKPRRDYAPRGEGGSGGSDRPFKPRGDKPGGFRAGPRPEGRPGGGRSFGDRPGGDRPRGNRPDAPRGPRKPRD